MKGLRCVLVGAMLAAIAGGAWADWRESYRAGLEAFAARRWADVVREMNAALADRAEERAGNSVLVRRYTPRYYLATAMAEQGDCRGALPVFREAADLGQIQRTDQFTDFKRRQRACEVLLNRASNASASAGAAVEKAEGAAADAARLSGDPVLAPLWEEGDPPSLASLYDQADRTLRDARARLSAGRRQDDLEDLAAAQRLATQATGAFQDLLAEASAKRNAVTSATASALESLEQEQARGKRALRGVRDLAPYPRELGRRVAEVERQLDTIKSQQANADTNQLGALARALDDALGRLGQAARRPPKALLEAGESFLAGDMARTLELLASLDRKRKRVRAQVCLLGAAAAFAQAELAEPGSALETAQLEEQLAGCRDLDSVPDADASIFSPRFVAFLESTLTAPVIDAEAVAVPQ